MASDNEASCASDPNFAVICSFLECFGKSCGIVYPDIAQLQEMLENTQEVPQQLIDLHIKLLRKTRKTVSPEKWERALVKFCHTYSNQDGWELERFGYKKARIAVKLRLLKVLLETQFDLNQKFKNEVNKLAAEELRVEPLGRDKCGLAYWCQLDDECNIRVYREDIDEENWELVAKDRDGVVTLINTLSNGEAGAIPINEDSNSLEISEKPIIDTGQITTSPSLEEDVVQENGVHVDGSDEKELDKSGEEEFDDEQDQDDTNDIDNDEDEMEDGDDDDDVTNDDSSKQTTEEDDSQETIQNPLIESNSVEAPPLISTNVSKTLNGKVGLSPEKQSVTSQEKENMPHETVISVAPECKPVEMHKVEDFTRTSSSKIETEEAMPVKSIETPVITSPLKLVNVAELKQVHEEKPVLPVTSIGASLSITKKHCNVEDTTESVMKSLEKLSGKNNLTFSSTDMPTSHSKLSVKPIDQLAANLVRIQSEKLEKPSGAKSLEKIAENLARSGSILGGVMNGEDDRLPQDFCARGQLEKPNVLRGHRGMDLSTSPRGWESTNEQNRPVDFSGIDLSSRKFNKTIDLPPSGYRTQDFQHREMDLSTKKLNKPEVTNLAYDARAVMMRNHAMIADLSKRQMPFSAYEMTSTAYHNAARIPGKEEHRLPNYTILPDPSKITALRMGNATVKRPMEGDDAQQDMLKRIRADVIPIRGSMEKRPMINTNWRDDIGEAIEEPVMMVQGEGSGSDCDAVNPGLGEAIEEPVVFFYGEGSGKECGTGKPGDDASTDNKESNESKSEADSATASISPSKSLTEDSLMNEVSAGSIVSNITTVKLNRNYPQSSVNVKDNCQVVGSTQEKPKFKPTLGIQIIPKSAGGSVKRLSRWDVGKPEEKAECDSSIISNEGDISPKRNTYDYECHNKQQSIASTNEDFHQRDAEFEGSTSTTQDVEVAGSSVKVDNAATYESNAELGNEESNAEDKHPTEQEESSTIQDSVQCDSSISLCQADTSEALDSCMEATPKTHSTSDKNTVHNACDSDNITSCETGISEKLDNECKPVAVSPPRFFFGPNCISYTSKPETSETHSDQMVTTSVHSKPDTLQYECVSSSKPVDEMIISCKTDDFDVTQTNNNSLKVSSFTPGSNNVLCESDRKRDVEKTDGPSNTWDQTISAKFSVEEPNYAIPKTDAGLCNSESKLEAEESVRSSVSSDPISSSENATSDYVQSEKLEVSDAIPQPHSTNDLITPVNKEESEDTKQESTTIEPPVTESDLPVESTGRESVEAQCNEFNEFSAAGEPKAEDTVEETTKISTIPPEDETDCKSSDTLTFKDDAIKKDLTTTASSCSSSLTQNSQSEVADIREFESEGNFGQLNRMGASEFPGYQEVDSSAIQDVDQISDKYQPFKNSGSDSPGESCDKQSDKNDNFSEFDGQEEQSMDTDTEKMKSLAGSDVDSMYVNYDKNSERTDALSDLGAQDEGSGDSEEIKEKTMVDSLTKDSVPDLSMETDFIENSGVTSTESIEQCNKNSSVPTISSTNDASIQDTSSQESIEAQNVSKEADNTSSVKDERPTYNILPPTVPDTNAFTQSGPDVAGSTTETGLPNLVPIPNEYADDASENRSSCNDQDSNEDMVIDDRLSESNESSKDAEEVVKNDEKLYSPETSIHDNNVSDGNPTLAESHTPYNNENLVNAFGVVPMTEEVQKGEDCQSVEKESHSTTLDPNAVKDNETSSEAQNETIDVPNDVVQDGKEVNQQNQDEILTSNNIDAVETLKMEENATEQTDSKIDQTDTAPEISQELSADNKQSLVANYDSGESNDGSDDVFETDPVESNEVKTNRSDSVEQTAIEKEELANDNQEEQVSESTNEVLPDQLENAVTDEEKVETNAETDDKSSLGNEEHNHKEPDVTKEAPTDEEYSCNNIQHDLSEKLIGPLNEYKYKEESGTPDALSIDSSERSDIAGLTKITGSSASSEISLESIVSQVNKKRVNIALVNNSLEVDEENEISVHAQDKLSSVLPEENDEPAKTELVNEVEKLPDTKEDVERIDIGNQIANVLKSKEQHLKPVEEKLMTNLENDSSFIKAKDETLVEEQIVQSFKKRKDICELGNKENKFDVNLHEECHVNRVSLEGIDTTPSVPNVLPLKLDNISSDMEKPQVCKDSIEANLEDSKPAENIHFTKLTEKSETLSEVDNYGKYAEPFNVISKAVEPYHKNMMPSVNDSVASFTMQEVAPEMGVVENDSKKETNKRLHDNIDLEDVPPLKSKPLCIEPNERPLETIDSSEVQLDKNFDTFQQVDTPLAKTPVADKVPDIFETSLQKTDYTPLESAESIMKEVQEKSDTESKKQQDSSEIQSIEVGLASDDEDSMGVDNESFFAAPVEEADPLAGSEDDEDDDETLKNLGDSLQGDPAAPKIGIRVKPVSELVYEGWKLDSTEPAKMSRKRRNSSHESNSEDASTKQEDEDDDTTAGKRIKLHGKRTPDKQLRRSVEDSRVISISSDEEAVKCSPDKEEEEEQENKDGSDDQDIVHMSTIERKTRGRPRGRRRRGYRGAGRQNRTKHSSDFQSGQTSEASSVAQLDGTPSNDSSLSMTPSAQKRRKKRKMVLGLEIGRDIAPEVQSGLAQDEMPVRQSRRIAQLKIKEEADRRRIEEETLCELKEKKDSAEKKKRKKPKPESEEEIVIKETEKEKKSKKKRRKRKKKKMLAKFNEANPWQSSSGSSSDEDNDNDDDEDDEEEMESEGSLLFKSDHEFSPESDLEKDQESEPMRRARTAQKAQSDVEEAEDEYACQKCGKADHPEWILLCDSCDKGWHCSCLRPALMLIPEGDWFCPPCQHNLLVAKLRESLKTYDQLTKRHENEVLRKKRLAFVGISLDNVLHKSEAQRLQKGSKASSQESENDTTSSSSASSSESSSSDESEPVYQLRERRCASTYKFNEYDDMINAAIQDEVEAVRGAGNQGRGKDIATIVNAEKEEAQLQFQAEVLSMQEMQEDKDNIERKSEKDSDEEYKIEGDDLMDDDEDDTQHKSVSKKLLARKKHRKLNSLDISSEDDPESDEDFKGTSSDDEEDFDDHLTSSDDSTFTDVKRRGKKGDSRPVRRSTRARMIRYDDDFINDDSEESDRPKRKKSRSMWGDSDSEDSDNSWRQRKKKSRTMTTTRCRTLPKIKSKKKKKRKRIIESDNQSENDEEDESRIEEPIEGPPPLQSIEPTFHGVLDVKLDNNVNDENNGNENNSDVKDVKLDNLNTEIPTIPIVPQVEDIVVPQKPKKENTPKPKKVPTIRRKIIYGGLPDENLRQEEEETLGRRTRGRKINYQEEIASDSEEELKKALRKTGESEDEFVVNEGEDMNEDAEKDSDSGDIYNPKKDNPKFKNKSPKSRRPRKSKSPGAKRRTMSDGTPKQRKKPGPKPGSKNKARKQKFMMGSVIKTRDDQLGDKDVMAHVIDHPMGELDSKIDDNLPDNVGLTGTTMSVASSFTGDVPEGSLTGLGPGELAELDDEQLEQMMMEDEEYGRRQLELAAIEIAKKKKKEEREAKKLEKARLKALEILAAERQRDPNAPEGADGEVPKKKKRGRRSKAEILAEQMRRDGAPNLTATVLPAVANLPPNVSPSINPGLSAIMTPDAERTGEGHIPMMTGPDGQLFNPDGSPMKPKRRGRGKGKKTLALEAARAAEAAAKAAAEAGLIGLGTDSNPEIKPSDVPNVLPTPGSSTSGSAPSTPPASAVTTQGPPSTQSTNSQAVYPSLPPNQQSSVITRMLQSQPVSSSPQSFTAAAAAMGHKYFGGPNAGGQMMGGPRTGYEMQPRGRIPSPYRQAGQSAMPPHFAAVRSGTPPMRMRVPGPQMYHTPHHPMDPSPSGGGPISINNRDRSSPLGPGPAMIPPAAGSPLAKGGPTPPPPPPPYVRGGPPLSRFADNPMGPRHQMPPFANASPANHNMQQPSPPPNRPPGNFSPYHPPPPPNYHYGAYPPPPPMSTADDAAAYQGSPYPAEHFSSPADNQPPPIQAPPPPQPQPQQQAHPNDGVPGNKQYDEEGTGEFGGLVSYFSSQREDDLDS